MKISLYRFALAGLALIPAGSWAQPKNVTLRGKLGTIDAPAVIELSYQVNGKTFRDSSAVKNGVYALSGHVDGPTNAYIVLYHLGKKAKGINSDMRQIFLEPGHLVMNSPDSLRKAVISGSALNKDQQLLTAALQPNTAKAALFYRTNGYLDPAKPQSQTFAAWYDQQLEVLRQEKKAIQRQFIKTHPDSWISLVTLRQYGVAKNGSIPSVADVEPLFMSLSARVRATKLGQEYQADLGRWKQVAIGSMAPDFTQLDPGDRVVKLSDFRGKYVLIDFWASWCHPCRDENPNLLKQYELYKGKNFEIVGITLDTPKDKAAWLRAIAKDGLTWPQLYDLKGNRANEAVVNYGVQSIPENFLLDPTGKIIARNLRGENLNATLKSVLDK